MSERRLIVVTLEGLATSALGCYGSSWNPTPTLDTIASVGCAWDQCIARSDDPLRIIKSWFCGGDESRFGSWRDRGRIELITDDSRVIELGADRIFDRTSLVNSLLTPVAHPAEEMALTAFGQLVATAIDRGSQSDPWSLLWLHSRFLTQRWDAPRGLQDDEFSDQPTTQEADPSEPEEPESIPSVFEQIDVPKIAIDDASHPDLVTSWMTTYGCQIQLIDDLIAVMLQSIDISNTVVILAGTSGFSLGQNGWIGHRVGPLRSCHTRLPLVIGCDGPMRWPRMTSSDVVPDLIEQLADASLTAVNPENWINQDQEFDPRLITQGSDQAAVTTSRWFLVCEKDQQRRLFVKPDDVEDFNDISRLRNDVTELLANDLSP